MIMPVGLLPCWELRDNPSEWPWAGLGHFKCSFGHLVNKYARPCCVPDILTGAEYKITPSLCKLIGLTLVKGTNGLLNGAWWVGMNPVYTGSSEKAFLRKHPWYLDSSWGRSQPWGGHRDMSQIVKTCLSSCCKPKPFRTPCSAMCFKFFCFLLGISLPKTAPNCCT